MGFNMLAQTLNVGLLRQVDTEGVEFGLEVVALEQRRQRRWIRAIATDESSEALPEQEADHLESDATAGARHEDGPISDRAICRAVRSRHGHTPHTHRMTSEPHAQPAPTAAKTITSPGF